MIKKVIKKINRRIGFFTLKAVALQPGQKPGLQYFALLRSRVTPTTAKFAMPCSPHRPPLFCPVSGRSLSGDGEIDKKESQQKATLNASEKLRPEMRQNTGLEREGMGIANFHCSGALSERSRVEILQPVV